MILFDDHVCFRKVQNYFSKKTNYRCYTQRFQGFIHGRIPWYLVLWSQNSPEAFLSAFVDSRLSLLQGCHRMVQRCSKKVVFDCGLKCERGKVSLQLPNNRSTLSCDQSRRELPSSFSVLTGSFWVLL